jgi:nuclear pore complex protein Nup107
MRSPWLIDSSPASPKLFTKSTSSAHEMLRPLRKTADRVTRQIEAFAEKLDQFKRKNTTDEFQNVQAAYKLVESYRDLTQHAMNELNRQQTIKKAKAGFRTSTGTDDTQSDNEARRLQLQVDTWRLLLNLISIDDPASRASFKEGQREAFQNLHRYSSDREIWEEFLNADQYALECVVSMRWLEETAKAAPQEIDKMIKELEDQAERGSGLWAHGWLFTKEAIKGHKRLRVWPQPLEPNDPAISRAHLNKDTQTPLITQLDPDALTRQKHSLEKQDGFYERATWMACWKMLRRGENWTTIREWAQSRLESWRAVSLCGSSVDAATATTRTPADDGMTRLKNSRAQDSWRAACHALTKDPNTSDYEKAVYALLCGESEPAVKICKTWDDYLYVYFNRIVLSRYQGFCRQFQRKLSQSPGTPVAFKPEPAGHADLQKFIQYLRGNETLSADAREPFRHIQAAILSKSYGSFFSQLSQAVSQVATQKLGKSTYIPDLAASHVDNAMVIMAEDLDAVQMATHIYVIVNSIGYASGDSQFAEAASVIVAGYIACLQDKCMPDLIPSYAALLPAEMCHSVLSKIIIEISEQEDRKYHIRVIQKHGIDINAVLDAQWSWLKGNVSSIEHSAGLTGYSRVRRLPDGTRVLMPPKKDLIGTSIAVEDERMIRHLEWIRCVGDQWSKICTRGTWLYRKFFGMLEDTWSIDWSNF